MVIWIVIGSLVGLIAVFLIVFSIKDRKKAKLIKEQKEEIEQKKNESSKNIVVFINELIKRNDKMLKNFVPSIGKVKMNDIRTSARKAISIFKEKQEYKMARESETEESIEILEILNKFNEENSNIWDKKLEAEIKLLNKKQKEYEKEFVDSYKKVVKKIINEAYK